MKNFALTLLILTAFSGFGQTSHNVFYIGHSACGVDLPDMLDDIAVSDLNSYAYDYQLIWGACLSWQWEWHDWADTVNGSDSWVELATGEYDVVTMMELLPLKETIYGTSWGCGATANVAGDFHQLAHDGNGLAQTYFIQLWQEYDINDPLKFTRFKDSINAEQILYEQVVDSVNIEYTGLDMCIIPMGKALVALADSIESGVVPGLASWEQLFLQGVDPPAYTGHMNDTGNYFNALVYYSTIYKSDPTGVTNMTYNWAGDPYGSISVAMATKMQEIAWDVVSNYEYSCINKVMTIQQESQNLKIFPNPTHNSIKIELDNEIAPIGSIQIFDLSGQHILTTSYSGHTFSIDVSSIPKGRYTLELKNAETNLQTTFLID